MAKKVVCRLFPEGTEFHDLGKEPIREKKYEIEKFRDRNPHEDPQPWEQYLRR